jgi:serine protease AprX
MMGRNLLGELRGRRRLSTTLVVLTLIAGATVAGGDAQADDGMPMGRRVTDPADCPGWPTAVYDAAGDPYSLHNQIRAMGAPEYWRAGYFGADRRTGRPIDIALIDSGVAPIAGFDAGNVVDGPDLSFEAPAASAGTPNREIVQSDTFGHGSHLAGIIVGRDDPDPSSGDGHVPFGWDDPAKFTGVAPAARILNMKVADSQGAVDVSQIIMAIDWVVEHRQDPALGLNVRVINLAYGVLARDDTVRDALTNALAEAWRAGIVVVVSAGNEGQPEQDARLLSPASDEDFIAVGAHDVGTMRSTDFSSKGTGRRPDLTAPGNHVMSLHVVGSAADDEIAHACREEVADGGNWSSPVFGPRGRFVRGSGTSQAAAMVSGAAALVLSKDPDLAPHEVKRHLVRTATRDLKGRQRSIVGYGRVRLDGPRGAFATPVDRGGVDRVNNRGGGTLERARGDDALPCLTTASVLRHRGRVDADPSAPSGARYVPGLCSHLQGVRGRELRAALEVDIRGNRFDARAHAEREARGDAWTATPEGEVWNGAAWVGPPVVDTRNHNGRHGYAVKEWEGDDWLGHRWKDHDWSGHRWKGDRWESDGLVGHRWKGDSWTGHRWADKFFRGSSWH